MHSRTVTAVLAISILAMSWITSGEAQTSNEHAGTANELFGLTKVWPFHVEVTAREYERMQPAGIPFFGWPGAKPAGKPPEALPGEEPIERHRGGSFGIEFPYAHADFTAEGKTYKNVGLRYKGGGSYAMSMGKLKRNFKVELDHYDAKHRYRGLKTLNLNASAADPTRMREALAFAVYRAAGVPASRTAYAEVTLTVPGKYDKELLGLYVVIEQVDKLFLEERFKDAKGLLMKPELKPGMFRSPFTYLGDDWKQYAAASGAKREPTKEEAQRVIGFARLIHKADDERFGAEIGDYLDIDEFLRFLAVTTLLANLDNFTFGHNFYVYLNPATNKFVFMPWDLDLAFGSFFLFGSQEQQAELSLIHPYSGENKLVDRLLAIPAVKQKYLDLLKDLTATCFSPERLAKDVDAIELATREIVARETKAAEARQETSAGFPFAPPAALLGQPLDVRTFVAKRGASVAAQLAGTSKGHLPVMSFNFGNPGAGAPGMLLAGPVLKAADTNADAKLSLAEAEAAARRLFQECDKENSGKLDEKALIDGITRLLPAPPAPPALPGGAAPARPPGGMGTRAALATAIVRVADVNKDKLITVDELVAAAQKQFAETVANDKSGLIDEKKLSERLNQLLRPPPGQPPPS